MLNYLLFIATIGSIYGLLALGLNLIWGGTGMVNLGLAGFFAARRLCLGAADHDRATCRS